MLELEAKKEAVMINVKMTGKKGKADRIQALEDMRTGKKKYLFATYSLAK
jgi:superfamily II DNA/RNA helicase